MWSVPYEVLGGGGANIFVCTHTIESLTVPWTCLLCWCQPAPPKVLLHHLFFTSSIFFISSTFKSSTCLLAALHAAPEVLLVSSDTRLGIRTGELVDICVCTDCIGPMIHKCHQWPGMMEVLSDAGFSSYPLNGSRLHSELWPVTDRIR